MTIAAQLAERSVGIAGAICAPASAQRLLILTFHRVLSLPDPLLHAEPDAKQFDNWAQVLSRNFNVLPLQEAALLLKSGSGLPARAVCVTFDDGYADNFRVALPILRKWGIPATFFIATGYLDGGRMFNDTVIEAIRRIPDSRLTVPRLGVRDMSLQDAAARRLAIDAVINAIKYRPEYERNELATELAAMSADPLPTGLMMSTDEVRGLAAAGMEVGGHTRHHPILGNLDFAAARAEVEAGMADLAAMTGQAVRSFAYPNGRRGRDYRQEHVQMVAEAGCTVAVTTQWGRVDRSTDALQLPRVAAIGRNPAAFGLRLARAYLDRPASD